MGKGQCAGCGAVKPTLRSAGEHIAACSDYARLWAVDRDRATEPGVEYQRRQAEATSAEHQQASDDELATRYAGYAEEGERKLTHAARRWSGARPAPGRSVPPPGDQGRVHLPPTTPVHGYGPATVVYLQSGSLTAS